MNVLHKVIMVLLLIFFGTTTIVLADEYCERMVGKDPKCDYLIGNITGPRPDKVWEVPKDVVMFPIDAKYGAWYYDTEGRPAFLVNDQYACHEADKRLSPVGGTLRGENKERNLCYALGE